MGLSQSFWFYLPPMQLLELPQGMVLTLIGASFRRQFRTCKCLSLSVYIMFADALLFNVATLSNPESVEGSWTEEQITKVHDSGRTIDVPSVT